METIAGGIAYVATYLGANAGTAYVIGQVGAAVVYAGAVYGVQQATAPDQTRPEMGGETRLSVGSDVSRSMVVGQRAVAGSLVDFYVDDEDRTFIHLVYALADHPVKSCPKFWGNGVLLNNGVPLVHGQKVQVTNFDTDDGSGRCWMTFYDGRPGQQTPQELIDVSKGEWSADHRGAGVAWVHVILKQDPTLMPSIPSWLWELEGAFFYDRRKDSTAGGSGTHLIDDPTTWEYTKNPMVQLDHYLLGYRVEQDPLAFGVGLTKDELPYAHFAAAADLSDEVIEMKEGDSYPRYEANGFISAADSFERVIEDIQKQMSARLVDLGGRIGVIGGEARIPVVDLSDQDLADNENFIFQDKRSFADMVGGASGVYADPLNFYQPINYETVKIENSTLSDGGELQLKGYDLPFETDNRKADISVNAYVDREQHQATLYGTFLQKAWALEPGDWFTYSSELEQLNHEIFEVIDVLRHDDFTITISAQATSPDVHAFDKHQAPDVRSPPFANPTSVFKLTVPSAGFTPLVLQGHFSKGPAVQVLVTDIDARASKYVVQLEPVIPEGDIANFKTVTQVFDANLLDAFVRSDLVPGGVYKCRIKARMGEVESAWSQWTAPITLSDVFEVPSAVIANQIVGQGWGATAARIEIDNAEVLQQAQINLADSLAIINDSIDDANSRIDGIEPVVSSAQAQIVDLQQADQDKATQINQLIQADLDAASSITSIQEVNDQQAISINNQNSQIFDPTTGLLARADTVEGRVSSVELNKADQSAVDMFSTSIAGNASQISNLMNTTAGLAQTDASLLTQINVTKDQILPALQGDGLIKNSKFNITQAGQVVPPEWVSWDNGTGVFFETANAAGHVFRTTGIANANHGFRQTINGIQPNTKYKKIAVVKRDEGAFSGSGLQIEFWSGSGIVGSTSIIFGSDAPIGKPVSQYHDGIVRYEKEFETPAGCDAIVVYCMTHWTGFGSIVNQHSIDWYEADIVLQDINSQRIQILDGNYSNAVDAIANEASSRISALEALEVSIAQIENTVHNFAPSPRMNDKAQQENAWPDGWDNFAVSGGTGWHNWIGKGHDGNPDFFKDWFPTGIQGIAQHVPGPSNGHFSDLRSDWFHAPIFEKEMFHSIFTGAHRCWMELHLEIELLSGGYGPWTGGVDFSNYRNADEKNGHKKYENAKRIWVKTPIVSDPSNFSGRIRFILRMYNYQGVGDPNGPYAFWHSPQSEALQQASQSKPSPYSAPVDPVTSAQIFESKQAVADINGKMIAGYFLRGRAGTSEWEFASYADGVAPSNMRLSADQIELHGDVIVDGSITENGIALNSITNIGGLSTDAVRGLAAYNWTEVESYTNIFKGGNVRLTVGAYVDLHWQGTERPKAFFRIKKNGVIIRSSIVAAAYMETSTTFNDVARNDRAFIQGYYTMPEADLAGSQGQVTYSFEIMLEKHGNVSNSTLFVEEYRR